MEFYFDDGKVGFNVPLDTL